MTVLARGPCANLCRVAIAWRRYYLMRFCLPEFIIATLSTVSWASPAAAQ